MNSLENVYTIIKPLCIEITKSPTKENIAKLNKEINKIDVQSLQCFQDVFLLQMIILLDHLDTVNKNEIKVTIVGTICSVLSKTKIKKIVTYKTLINLLIKNVYDEKKSAIHSNLSEEFKLGFIDCMRVTTESLLLDILETVYTKENIYIIAQLLYICVEMIRSEKYTKLKSAAIDCILSVMHINDTVNFDDIVLQSQLSDVLFITIPKTIAALTIVMNDDSKQSSHLRSNAVKAFGRILCLIMTDYNKPIENLELTPTDFKKLFNSSISADSVNNDVLGLRIKNSNTRREYFHSAVKSSEWIKAAVQKIEPVFRKLTHLQVNSNLNVRKELATIYCSLLDKCSINMKICVPHFIEGLIVLSEDENEEIRDQCSKSLLNFTLNKSNIFECLEDLFVQHLTRLPRIIYRGDDAEQASNLMLLKGFLKYLISSNLKEIIVNQQIFEKLLIVLIAACELDYRNSNDILKEEYVYYKFDGENDNTSLLKNWKKYKNIDSKRNVEIMLDICSQLSNSFTSNLLINSVLEDMCANKYGSGSNTLMHLINNLVIPLATKSTLLTEQKQLLTLILEEVLQDWHWNLDTEFKNIPKISKDEFGDVQWMEDRTEGLYESAVEIKMTDIKLLDEIDTESDYLTINDVKSNILHCCLIVESIGLAALALQNDFKPFIFRSLHKVLEKAGCNNTLIQMTAICSLKQITDGLGLSGINELIHSNSDYLTYHVNFSLKRIDKISMGLDILTVILKYSLLESMPYLENIINTVLNQLGNNYRPKNMTSHLKLLKYFIVAVYNWEKSIRKAKQEDKDISNNKKQTLVEHWQSIVNCANYNNDIPDDGVNIDEENDGEKEIEEEEKPILPSHIQVTVKILQVCLKYIPSFEQSDKIIILETLDIGLRIIENHENELLPLVHLVWYSFCERFNETNPIILSRSFSLLITLSQLAKSFIQRRTFTDVVPILNKFLINSSEDSQRNCNDISYTFTQQFKLQEKLLKEYPELLIAIDVQERKLNDVMDIVYDYYLNKKNQPKLLREAAQVFFEKFKLYNAPFVFVKLYKY